MAGFWARLSVGGNEHQGSLTCFASRSAATARPTTSPWRLRWARMPSDSEDAQEPAKGTTLSRSVPVFESSILVTHLIEADHVIRLHAMMPTTSIQLHDAIPVEATEAIRKALPHVPLIKAIAVTDQVSIEIACRFSRRRL